MTETFLICLALLSVWAAYRGGMEKGLRFAVLLLISLPVQTRIDLGGVLPILSINRLILVLIIWGYLTRRDAPTAKKSVKLDDDDRFIPTFLISAYLLSTFASTLVSVDFSISLKKFFSSIVEALLLFIVIAKGPRREDFFGKFLVGLVIVGIIVSSIGIIQKKLKWDPIPIVAPKFYDREILDVPHYPGDPIQRTAMEMVAYSPVMDPSRGLRPNSTFPHPILFGAFLVMIWPFSIILLAHSKYRMRRTIAWVYQFLMGACLYFTMSRGPWLGWILASCILFLSGSRAMKGQMIKIFLLGLLLLTIKPGVLGTLQRVWGDTFAPTYVQGTFNPLASSAGYRFALIKVGIGAVLSDPLRFLVGFGPGTFPLLGLTGTIAGETRVFWSTDCSYLRLLVGTGVLGIGFLMSMLFAIFVRVLNEYWKTSGSRRWTLLASLTSMSIFLFMMTNVDVYGWQIRYLFWSILGMTIALLSRDVDEMSLYI